MEEAWWGTTIGERSSSLALCLVFLWAGQQASNHCLHSCRKKVGGETHDSVDCAARVLVIVLLCGSFSQHSSFVLQAVHKMKAAWAGVGSQIDQWIRRQFYINGKQFNATISPQITTLNDHITLQHTPIHQITLPQHIQNFHDATSQSTHFGSRHDTGQTPQIRAQLQPHLPMALPHMKTPHCTSHHRFLKGRPCFGPQPLSSAKKVVYYIHTHIYIYIYRVR